MLIRELPDEEEEKTSTEKEFVEMMVFLSTVMAVMTAVLIAGTIFFMEVSKCRLLKR